VSASPGEQTTILFADIGGSVRLYQEVGDVDGHRYVSESLQRMATAIEHEGGAVLRTVGDAALARFDNPNQAAQAAVAIQQSHQDSPLSVRVGFHHGSVIEDKGDIYGNAVNIAARIAAFARVNEITTTSDTVDELGDQHKRRATLLKESTVRGIDNPIHIYRIEWQGNREEATRIATRIATPSEQALAQVNHHLEIQFQNQAFALGERRNTLTIGRTELSDVCVLTDRASREHALLEYRDGQFTLTDTSTNGTYIQKLGQPAYLVQRETVILDGKGAIGVGVEPLDPTIVNASARTGDDAENERATLRFSVEFA